MLVYSGGDLKILSYTYSDFQGDRDSKKSTSGLMFTLSRAVIVWRSVKQSNIIDSTIETKYIAASEVAKEAVWLKNFLSDFPNMDGPITLYCDNSGAVANSKEPRSHKKRETYRKKVSFDMRDR